MRIYLFLVILLPLAAACSAITDPGRFQFDAAPPGSACPVVEPADLAVELHDFQAFENERIEIRVVDDSNALVLRAVLEGLDDEGVSEDGIDTSTLLCLVFPELADAFPVLTIRAFVDLEDNGEYQPVDAAGVEFEPGWQIPVVDGVATIVGTDRITGFDEPIIPAGDFNYALMGMDPHVPGTQHFAEMIIDADGLPVGFYRISDLDTVAFSMDVESILEPDSDYTVEFYADFVQNGVYDPPPMGDHSWRENYRSDGEGTITEIFDHVFDFQALDFF